MQSKRVYFKKNLYQVVKVIFEYLIFLEWHLPARIKHLLLNIQVA
jgi:hypothetical protein